MKKTYIKPEIDITAFTTEDIITVSNNLADTHVDSGSAVTINVAEEYWTEE